MPQAFSNMLWPGELNEGNFSETTRTATPSLSASLVADCFFPFFPARLARPPRSAWQEGGPAREQWRAGGKGKRQQKTASSVKPARNASQREAGGSVPKEAFSRKDNRRRPPPLQQSERILEKKYLPKRPIEELIEVVSERLDLSPELICSGSRKRLISDARALLAYLAVEETGHKATDVARVLGIKRVSVHHAAKKGEKVL